MKKPESFQVIADTIERDIAQGRYAKGTRLPTHRGMAASFGVAVATVSRAYAEVRRRGLTEARAGRGTFVRAAGLPERHRDREQLDLTVSALEPYRHAAEIFDRLRRVAPADMDLLRYTPTAGLPQHRDAAAAWLRNVGLECPGDRVLLTSGAQQGIAVTLTALLPPGAGLLAESLTYPGLRSVAEQRGLRLHAVGMDGEGLIPEALAIAARSTGARVLYCIPTLQNPTSAVMSVSRREALVGVARTLDLTIVEDDVYGPLVPNLPRVASLAPERTVYLSSAAKSLAAGLRLGFVVAPEHLCPHIEHAVAAATLAPSPLLGETVRRLIVDGVAEQIVQWKRRELAARQDLVTRAFAGLELRTHPVSQNVWLHLPSPWTADRFVPRAQLEGVLVSPASAFALDVPPPEAVRFSVGPPETRAQLEGALKTLRKILRHETAARLVI